MDVKNQAASRDASLVQWRKERRLLLHIHLYWTVLDFPLSPYPDRNLCSS